MMITRKTKYALSAKRIAKSPFAKGRSIAEAIKLVKRKEREYQENKDIGFSYKSSLKSMGRIKRRHGEYQLGNKYK